MEQHRKGKLAPAALVRPAKLNVGAVKLHTLLQAASEQLTV